MFEDSSLIDKPFASSSGRVEFIIFEEILLTLDTYTRVVLDSIQEVVGQQRAELETLRKAYPGWEYIWFTQAEWTMGTEGRLAWIEDLFPRFLYGSFLALLLSALEQLLVNILLIFVDFAQIKDQLRKGGVIERVLKMLKERGVQIRIPSAIWDSLMALRRARNEFVHFASHASRSPQWFAGVFPTENSFTVQSVREALGTVSATASLVEESIDMALRDA